MQQLTRMAGSKSLRLSVSFSADTNPNYQQLDDNTPELRQLTRICKPLWPDSSIRNTNNSISTTWITLSSNLTLENNTTSIYWTCVGWSASSGSRCTSTQTQTSLTRLTNNQMILSGWTNLGLKWNEPKFVDMNHRIQANNINTIGTALL